MNGKTGERRNGLAENKNERKRRKETIVGREKRKSGGGIMGGRKGDLPD